MGGLETRALAMALSMFSLLAGITTDLYADAPEQFFLGLVSQDYPLESSYEPVVLAMPEVRRPDDIIIEDIYLLPEAAQALELLFDAAAGAGYTLYAVSGYRSYPTQETLYKRKVGDVGEEEAVRLVAPPGASEHQSGLAMDINGQSTIAVDTRQAFGESPEGLWVQANAHLFGFTVRYPQGKGDITGYAWAPWHLRYVGPEAATEMYELNVTLEEYHEVLQLRRIEAWVSGGEDDFE